MKLTTTLLLLFSCTIIWAQQSKKVFFIGNSYTGTNNIPLLIQKVATSSGDQLVYEAHTPGGSTLQQHANNQNVLNKINSGNWDYVVLQEQSQLPSFPPADVNNLIAPYAAQLSNHIKQSNPCTQVTFYMTWGRKNGDPQNCPMWPPVCTYTGMDNLIRQTYTNLANDNEGIISPVGVVWRYLIDNYPDFDLYSNDESHPSIFGSMASAYTFYTVFYKRSPYDATFASSLNANQLTAIKEAVKAVVFDNMEEWRLLDQIPSANFNYSVEDGTVTFTNTSINAETYEWDFGDGTTDNSATPIHTYTEQGTYTVSLTVTKCGKSNTITKTIQVENLSLNSFANSSLLLYPNPASANLNLNTDLDIQTINVFDIMGRSYKTDFQRNTAGYIIDIQNLATGIYILQIEKSGSTTQLKFVKN